MALTSVNSISIKISEMDWISMLKDKQKLAQKAVFVFYLKPDLASMKSATVSIWLEFFKQHALSVELL